MEPVYETSRSVMFGRFQVLPHRRELLINGQPVKLGGRAFDVLLALIDAQGGVISKEALMARVWPEQVIEENGLAVQIGRLRKAFGSDRDLIRTVSGRGYQFTVDIPVALASSGEGIGAVAARPGSVLPPTNIPGPVSELIGREEELGEILKLAATHRLLTLTGAGGIGKTALALALARELRSHFADGVWIAELSAISDCGLVPAMVAAALGLDPGRGEDSAQCVAQAIAGRQMLLILDTCEHVIAGAATFAEAILRAGSDATIIATSREPLRTEGEWLYPVPPLAMPAMNIETGDDPLKYGASRLFVERALAVEPHFAPDRHSSAIVAICRGLDGIPLAIELASARVAALGIEQVAARLEDRFHLLTGGRRTAMPRHQTLRATLDWSYKLLTEPERLVLRRLAIFNGYFTLEAATAVVSGDEISPFDVFERIVGLVARSLVSTAANQGAACYRLLDTMRAYALEKLDESGEQERLSHHHAEYYRHLSLMNTPRPQ
jgi:predicted ATPase/DNA-binding winged helix-turn-helix (wHTH) protein